MAGGRLKLEVLAAGAVVPAFQMQDAVNAGILDGGHGVCAYWYGKHKAFSLFGTPPSLGWNATNFLGWFHYGGGEKLYNELVNDILKLNVVGFLSAPMPTQPLGWFKKEIKSPDDLKNVKYRTVGLSADLFKEMGAAVTILAGGEIVPAMDRGLLDAAEFNNPSSDILLGFADVSKFYMMQSYHQAAESFEIIFNKRKYEALPAELRAILKYGAEAASSDMIWKALDRYSKDLEELRKRASTSSRRRIRCSRPSSRPGTRCWRPSPRRPSSPRSSPRRRNGPSGRSPTSGSTTSRARWPTSTSSADARGPAGLAGGPALCRATKRAVCPA